MIGATGTFGERLVGGLHASGRFGVILAARDHTRLDAAVARLGAGPWLSALALDARCVTPAQLRGSGAFAVVDAAGPFQNARYGLAEAAIAAGLHYIDLADARDFVAGFAVLDPAARAAGVVSLTGASSTPALSNAVLDQMTAGWRQVTRVEIAISPGNRAPRGLAVMRSILSYSGRPVRVWDGGRWCERPGWGMTVRRVMPGLGPRWLSLAETPDLDIVPERFAVTDMAIFRAGLELSTLHLGLSAASLTVRTGLLPSLVPFARLFRWMADRLKPFGTDRGGMTVEADGLDAAGQPVRGVWSLLAEAGHGPVIPTLPALAALRALADGRLASPGATACVGMLPLAWIEAEFAGYNITSRMVWGLPPSQLTGRHPARDKPA